jgi:hypothetical protein
MGPLYIIDMEYGFMTKKYRVLVSFCRKLMIFAKTVCHLQILSKNLEILKTHKNTYVEPLCITDPEYGGHDHEIQSFGLLLP